jgi:hypothetical protein
MLRICWLIGLARNLEGILLSCRILLLFRR